MIHKLYTKNEVAAILGIGKTSLYHEVKNNRLIPTFVGKGRLRFTPEAIHNYLQVCNGDEQLNTTSL